MVVSSVSQVTSKRMLLCVLVGGKLEAGWQATADFSLSEGRSVHVLIRSVPPQVWFLA